MPRQSARSQALSQRARDEASRVARNFESAAQAFENEVRGLDFALCAICRKRTGNTELRAGKCSYCARALSNPFSAENGMDIGEIPPELRGLSLVEEALIARVHPVVSGCTRLGSEVSS